MPPTEFENLANAAFEEIKRGVSISAEYFPKAGGKFSIRGPLDDRGKEVDPDTETIVSTNIYTFGLHLSDIPSYPKKGDQLVVKNTTYKVIQVDEDGVPGVSVVLILHRLKETN